MGVTRKLIKQGNSTDKPKKGDEVIIEYTGNLYDSSVGPENDFRGKPFDSSVGRGDFKTQIGVGKVIQGLDEGVMEMTVGEKSILTISADYAYGDQGFPGFIPPNATLIFKVELKAINGKEVEIQDSQGEGS